MNHQVMDILRFFYTEAGPTSAYNNRFIFGMSECDFYQVIELLEHNKYIEAIGIRHSFPGYNLYQITTNGIAYIRSTATLQ